MSAVIAVPELMAGAATDLAAIGSTLNAAHLIRLCASNSLTYLVSNRVRIRPAVPDLMQLRRERVGILPRKRILRLRPRADLDAPYCIREAGDALRRMQRQQDLFVCVVPSRNDAGNLQRVSTRS